MDTSRHKQARKDWTRAPVTGREAQRFLAALSRCSWAELESMAATEGRRPGDFLTYLAVRADSAIWNPNLGATDDALRLVLNRMAQLISVRDGMDVELRESIAFFWETIAEAGDFARDMPEREALLRELFARELTRALDPDTATVWVRAKRALDAWSRRP